MWSENLNLVNSGDRKLQCLFTVWRSLLKRIRATNPDPIPKGARLMKAKNFPMRSPEKNKKRTV